MGGKELSVREKALSLRASLRAKVGTIQRQWPGKVDEGVLGRFIDAVVTSCTRIPSLLDDPSGVIRESMLAARLGLEPNPVLGHCAIVPFARRATLIVQYQGMAHVLWTHNGIVVDAEAVYEGDFFEYELGLDQKLRHVPAEKDRGNLRCAYAVFRYPDGRTKFKVVAGDRIRAIKAAQVAKAKKYGKPSVWEDVLAEPEMWAKTAVRAGWKMLPKDAPVHSALAEALSHEDVEEPEEIREVEVEIVDDLDAATAELNGRAAGEEVETSQPGAPESDPGPGAEEGEPEAPPIEEMSRSQLLATIMEGRAILPPDEVRAAFSRAEINPTENLSRVSVEELRKIASELKGALPF